MIREAAVYNWTITTNMSWEFEMVLSNDDGTPINLTGATVRMQARDRSGSLVIDLSTSNGKLKVDPLIGRIYGSGNGSEALSPRETALLSKYSKLTYSVALTWPPSGPRDPYLRGVISIVQGDSVP